MTLPTGVRFDRPQNLRFFPLFLCFASGMADIEAPSTVFAGSNSSLNLENSLYLEGLAAVKPNANSKIEHLALSVAFVDSNSRELYANAVKNLKEALPNLKSVKFNGGYVFDPANDTPAVFEKEAKNLKAHFDTLAKLFKEEKLPVDEVKFTAMMAFEGRTVDSADFTHIYQQLFGAQFNQWLKENRQAEFEYTKDGIKFIVKCSLSLTLLKGNKGVDTRYEFYDEVISVND